jgi:Ala-tRNA(Pro) deacylase
VASFVLDRGLIQEAAMAVTPRVQEFLRMANVPYAVLPHPTAYTAQEEAAITHVPGRDWAKVVALFADDRPIQAVVPADRVVDLDRLLLLTGSRTIRLAREDELDWLFPECESGAMPPFGPLYHQAVFVDESLASEPRIAFHAGTHRDAVSMRYMDFEHLIHPTVGYFASLIPS